MSTTVSNKEGIQYGTAITMETIVCYKCSIPFAVPDRYKEHLQSSCEMFYCPNGHGQAYVKSTEQRLRDKILNQQKDYEAALDRMRNTLQKKCDEIDQTKRKLTGQKIQLSKIKNRINNGVCPCCNRSFVDLAAHMKTKHPGFINQHSK